MPSKPAGAKAPTDHQPKIEKPRIENVEIDLPDGLDDNDEPKTRKAPARRVVLRGITVTVPEEALDDFEVLDDIRAVQDANDASRFPSLLSRLVGDDYKRILNELRDPVTRRVKASEGSKFVMDLFQALDPNS